MLADGKAQAFATDDILLYGLIARHKAQDKFKVVGDYLSYDPYGIMFRKGEPQLSAVVERTFRKLATNHDLVPLYKKWFLARLPTASGWTCRCRCSSRRPSRRSMTARARTSGRAVARSPLCGLAADLLHPAHVDPDRRQGAAGAQARTSITGGRSRST